MHLPQEIDPPPSPSSDHGITQSSPLSSSQPSKRKASQSGRKKSPRELLTRIITSPRRSSPRKDKDMETASVGTGEDSRDSSPRVKGWSDSPRLIELLSVSDSPPSMSKAGVFPVSDVDANIAYQQIMSELESEKIRKLNVVYFASDSERYHFVAINIPFRGWQVYLIDFELMLGRGRYSKVFPAYDLFTKRRLVAKVYLPAATDDQINDERRNLEMMGELATSCTLSDARITLFDYAPGIELSHFLYGTDETKDKEDEGYYTKKTNHHLFVRFYVCYLVIDQLRLIHSKGLIHRDLKIDNIKIDNNQKNWLVKILDIGEAILFTKKTRAFASSYGYASPEVCKGYQSDYYSFQSDYFALGVVLAEILTDKNYQALLYQKNEERNDEREKGGDSRSELSAAAIFKLMPDVFEKIAKLEPAVDRPLPKVIQPSELSPILLDKMFRLIGSLTAEDPAKRLEGLNLEDVLEDLKPLAELCQKYVPGIVHAERLRKELQQSGLDADAIWDLTGDHIKSPPIGEAAPPIPSSSSLLAGSGMFAPVFARSELPIEGVKKSTLDSKTSAGLNC